MLIRPGAVGRLGQPARTARALFSPSSLFANGEQGVFYDISDTTTLFQDSAGVTPVTAVEQTVGLILDKSKGLVLGSELAPQDFTTYLNYGPSPFDTLTATLTTLRLANATVKTSIASSPDSIPVEANKTYKVTFDVSVVSGGFDVSARNSAGATSYGSTSTLTTSGTYSFVFLSPSSQNVVVQITSRSGVADYTISNVSVRELPGNHAFQTDSAKRPLWSSRVNLLTRTEEFNDAAWTKITSVGTPPTVSANTTTAPDGTLTADTYIQAASPGSSRITQDVTLTAGTVATLSVSIKQKTGTWARLILTDSINTNACVVHLDMSTGQLGTSGTTGTGATFVSSSVAPQDNGFYRVNLTGITPGTTYRFFMDVVIADGSNTRLAGGEMFLWGADLRVANESSALPPYQRVVTATDYDTTGFPAFLRFDGTNDALVTNSINFTATDEMSVFAGVRKLSDDERVFVELSASISTSAGSFLIVSGSNTGVDGVRVGWNSGARGSAALVGAQISQAYTFTAPDTAVLSSTHDISGDLSTIRRNALAGVSATGDKGTGNFGNHPLYIGARGTTQTVPFNGRLHSLIVLGRTVTPTELTQTEGYVEAKTFGKDMNYVLFEPVLGSDGDQITLTAGGDDLFVYQNYE